VTRASTAIGVSPIIKDLVQKKALATRLTLKEIIYVGMLAIDELDEKRLQELARSGASDAGEWGDLRGKGRFPTLPQGTRVGDSFARADFESSKVRAILWNPSTDRNSDFSTNKWGCCPCQRERSPI
jgi:hypothetical protein